VRSITDLMVLPGLINLDFADVRTVMTEMGKAMMGTGEAEGEGRALMAAENAIQNPLLDEVSLKGAKAVLVNVTGGLDMTLLEVDEAANAISDQVDPDGNIIFGAAFDPSLDGVIRVSVVATGMDGASMAAIEPARPRAPSRAAPLIAPQTAAAAEPVMEPVRAEAWTMEAETAHLPEPTFFEAEATEEQATLTFDDAAGSEPAVVARIVDPLVAEEDEDEPLVADSHYEEQPRKGGWLSLFGGRPRHEPSGATYAPPQRAAAGGGAAAAAQPIEEAIEEENDDLEIPSFLRRLAN
jgi:cell division protein FtsZ